MGLDNGVSIRRNAHTTKIPELQRFAETWDEKCEYDFEVCYWRKCYNIRSMILDTAEGVYDCDDSEPLTIEDIDNIIEGLRSFNSKNWGDNGGSIWDWDDEEYPYSEKIQRDIENLEVLRGLMDKYDLEVYFYDSY